jgi:hypothetical protein
VAVRLTLVFIVVPILLATLLLFFGMPIASGHNETINISLSKSAQGVYVHGDNVTTLIDISTGLIEFHENVDEEGNGIYNFVFTATLADHPNVPVVEDEKQLFIPPMRDHFKTNFTKPLIEGYWLLHVVVRDGYSDGLVLTEWNDTIVVQSAITDLIERQATAAEKTAINTPTVAGLSAGTASVISAVVAWRIARKTENDRMKKEQKQKAEFRAGIRMLIQKEMTSLLKFMIELDEKAGKMERDARGRDRELNKGSDFWSQAEHMIRYPTMRYLRMPWQIKAQVLEAGDLDKVEEAYRAFGLMHRTFERTVDRYVIKFGTAELARTKTLIEEAIKVLK